MSLCDSHTVSWGRWKSISVRNKFKWFSQTGLIQRGKKKLNIKMFYNMNKRKKTMPLYQSIKSKIFLCTCVNIQYYLFVYMFILFCFFAFTMLWLKPHSHLCRSSGALQAEPGPHRRWGEEAVHIAETQRQRGASPLSLQWPRSPAAHRQWGDLGF